MKMIRIDENNLPRGKVLIADEKEMEFYIGTVIDMGGDYYCKDYLDPRDLRVTHFAELYLEEED